MPFREGFFPVKTVNQGVFYPFFRSRTILYCSSINSLTGLRPAWPGICLVNILLVYTFEKRDRMKNLSLKMDDVIFHETEQIIAKMNKNRNRYINEAVGFYNLLQKRRIISRQLRKESRIVREESMKVLSEFEKLQDEDQAI
jgi:hypothetical protein